MSIRNWVSQKFQKPQRQPVVETHDWDVPTEIYVHEPDIKTEDVSINTQLICIKCNCKSYTKDGKCVKCEHQWF